ncbi:MBL fold metallo-hydrolase [Actinotalea sp. M2MS4P-6]|uniref:alkyl/aryl-sulfatase n=1 Tax=Actinotalea sp. M2MS4P-6 TaxID=2983762 RepID=UPI0021E42357|nr:alkyl sulfatase dimerization domain-containing protein [Actinotalea sp. M2MS4P-6]MCV2394726.1 MBL fold metallo-hydrolase [Actinotalea sp. M2MS4P-6]
MATQKDPTAIVIGQQRALAERWPFDDTQDFADAERGFIAKLEPGVVRADDGRVVWDNDSYAFISGEAPGSVNPSLWRQSSLVTKQGLFEVTEGIYQVRGLDLSNITFVEGDSGVVVIDPLISTECAAAALALYREHRGDRPVTGVIYTHSHADHFGGVKGVTTQADVDAGRVAVLAPEGFVHHAIAENVYAGTAMSRRAGYMYGAALDRGPRGAVGAGLGQTTSTGTITLIVPTVDITSTGQVEVVDGLEIEFQMAPGTEAPAEMHFYFPRYRALCMAENATHNLHNLLTLRGALVRDPNVWSKYLTEAIDLFSARSDVAFASHHWPTWGGDRILTFLETQRDLYAYLHDQTLRMLNQGLTGPEIAEAMTLPPALEKAWSTHGYYGSVSHNVKAIYQRYLGWFDGNPAHLWQHPPVEQAIRYVEFMGGADAVVAKARGSFDAGDYRWVAEVLGHVVFAEPGHAAARELLADTYEQLGYGSENGTWRNFYLSGATELREGSFGTPIATSAADMIAQLTPEMLFDALAIQVDGPRAWDDHLTIDVAFTDDGARYRVTLANGVLTHRRVAESEGADATLTLPHHAQLAALAGGGLSPEAMAQAGIELAGDASALGRLMAVLDPGDPDFAIVTPEKE